MSSRSNWRQQRGYAMAALLVGLTVMSVVLSMALPVWRTAAQREREAELVFRGEQYARAVELFQRKYAGAFPPNLDILLNERFLRKRYKDPMTEDGEFQLLFAGQTAGQPGRVGQPGPGGVQGGLQDPAGRLGAFPQAGRGQQQPQLGRGGPGVPGVGVQTGIMGVASKSTGQSIRLYNGRGKYNEWTFVATQASTQAGAPTGGQPGRGGVPGGPGITPGAPGTTPGGGIGPGRGAPPGRGMPPQPGRGFPSPPQPGRGQRPSL